MTSPYKTAIDYLLTVVNNDSQASIDYRMQAAKLILEHTMPEMSDDEPNTWDTALGTNKALYDNGVNLRCANETLDQAKLRIVDAELKAIEERHAATIADYNAGKPPYSSICRFCATVFANMPMKFKYCPMCGKSEPPPAKMKSAQELMTLERAVDVLNKSKHGGNDVTWTFTGPDATRCVRGSDGVSVIGVYLTEFEAIAIAEKLEQKAREWPESECTKCELYYGDGKHRCVP